MAESLKPKEMKRVTPCPYSRRVSVIPNIEGYVLVGLCGRKEGETRLPTILEFERSRRCKICTGGTGRKLAELLPAIVKQSFEDLSLLKPLTKLTYVRVSENGISGVKGIEDLESRWEEELEKIRHPQLPT